MATSSKPLLECIWRGRYVYSQARSKVHLLSQPPCKFHNTLLHAESQVARTEGKLGYDSLCIQRLGREGIEFHLQNPCKDDHTSGLCCNSSSWAQCTLTFCIHPGMLIHHLMMVLIIAPSSIGILKLLWNLPLPSNFFLNGMALTCN